MAGIFQGDIIIKTAIELGLEDFRNSPYLVDHMLDDLTSNQYLSSKYGQKQVDACKEWLRNTKIEVVMRGRMDKDDLPLVTIEMGPTPEKEDMKHMGDDSTESVILLPKKIGKPIKPVMKAFTTFSYDPASGMLTVTGNPPGIDSVADGMIIADPATGNGYPIQSVEADGFQLEPGLTITATKLVVVPQYMYYTARVEHTFFAESYNIGCHAHGDAQTMLWLWSIVKYSLLRYRESLLEFNGFAESKVTSASPEKNGEWTTPGGETAWSRYITLSGQVENTWIKAPHRIIENAALKDVDKSTSPSTIKGGIKIISNSEPLTAAEEEDESWYPIED